MHLLNIVGTVGTTVREPRGLFTSQGATIREPSSPTLLDSETQMETVHELSLPTANQFIQHTIQFTAVCQPGS